MGELLSFRFHGDDLQVIPAEGTITIVIRRFCEALGLAFWPQLRKLKSDPSISVTMMVMQVSGDDQRREVACLDLRSLPLWLATIHPSKVAPELREKLVAYKREAAESLAEHFLGRRGHPVKLRSGAFEEIFGDVFDKARKKTQVEPPPPAHAVPPPPPRTIPELQHAAVDVLRGALDRGDDDGAKLLLRTIGVLVGRRAGRRRKNAAADPWAQQELDLDEEPAQARVAPVAAPSPPPPAAPEPPAYMAPELDEEDAAAAAAPAPPAPRLRPDGSPDLRPVIFVDPDALDEAIDAMVELFRHEPDFFLNPKGRLVRVIQTGTFDANVHHLRDRFSRLARFEKANTRTGARERTYPPPAIIRGVIQRAPTWAKPIPAPPAPTPAPQEPAAPDVGAFIVAGLAAAMKAMDVEEVRARQLLDAFPVEHGRFRLLREAIQLGFPQVPTDRLPNEKQLGRMFGRFKGQVHGGRRIAFRILDGRTLWRVEDAPAVGADLTLQ